MDIATIIGLVASFTLVFIAMGDPVSFLDIP
jgi:flagellar motor component MotA